MLDIIPCHINQDPMYVYPYEALEGFTMALMMTSAVTYVAKISTPTTIASVIIIVAVDVEHGDDDELNDDDLHGKDINIFKHDYGDEDGDGKPPPSPS